MPYDLLIIGAGATGLYAAFCAGLRGLTTAVVDSLPLVGGQLVAYYPEKRIYDVPGFEGIVAAELIEKLDRQARRFPVDFRVETKVSRIVGDAGAFEAHISNRSESVSAKAVLLTSGVGVLAARKLGVGSDEWVEDRLEKPQDCSGQRVLVVGGTLPAVKWAMELVGHAREITLIHRHDHFHAPAEMVDRLRRSPVMMLEGMSVVELLGQERLESARLEGSGREMEIPVDRILAATGYTASLAGLREWSVELDGPGIRVDPHMQTSRPGIWAAGDIATYAGKTKLLVSNFAEASAAVNRIKIALDPSARLFPGHSSEDCRFTP